MKTVFLSFFVFGLYAQADLVNLFEGPSFKRMCEDQVTEKKGRLRAGEPYIELSVTDHTVLVFL